MKKKILALLLSGVLTLSMLSTAFAIETHNVLTVTVSGNTATVNGTYEGLKPGNYPVAVNSSTASLGVVNVTVNADGSISGEGTIDGTDVDASDLTVLTSIPMSEGSESVTLTNKDSEPTTKYTVTFDLNGGTSEAIPAQTVEEGKTATKPADPTWTDHTFEGWFTNKDHAEGETDTPFDFSTPITGNTTLYAHWTGNGGGEVEVTSVTLNKTSLSLVEGNSETLTATVTVTPDVDANKKVAWQSSNSTIAAVKDGVVTGVKAGTATITATSIADGTKSASCIVTVTAKSGGGNTGDNQGSSSGSSSNGTSGSSSPAIKPLPDRNHGTTTPANPSDNPGTTPTFFNDVPANYWAAGAIEWVNENGFMKGINETTFNPEGNITRQQMWMILSRMAGSSAADMAAARTWAMGRNLTDGTNPAGSMTRQQLVTYLYRFAQRQGFTLSGSSPLTTFPDNAQVASYAQTPLSWAVANGIIAGKNDGRLDPTGTATRAQFATILQRFYTNIVNKNA